jgi:phosphate transport system permease protein
MNGEALSRPDNDQKRSLLLSERATRLRRVGSLIGHSFLFVITAASAIAVLFIFAFIIKDALPFFRIRGLKEFFTSTAWYPSREPASFGALAIFYGSAMVTLGAVLVAVPLGVAAAVCLSDVLPFWVRQLVKPVVEILAAIPSVAYGFFALVVFAPLLQRQGGHLLSVGVWFAGVPVVGLGGIIVSEAVARRTPKAARVVARLAVIALLFGLGLYGIYAASRALAAVQVVTGTNALNVSIILGIMALPTIVSVSEDALQAAGRELREASYALGATRVETIFRVIMPAAGGGICAAIILGVMRAIGETMVVWMASGNSAQIPEPWYNYLEPIRTLTATIAGEMGEADQVTGSARYHVLFAMALCLLVFCFVSNVVAEWVTRRTREKLE